MWLPFKALNEYIAESRVGRYFKLKERGSDVATELRGSLATFMTMAYILAVNASIVALSGGPCGVPPFIRPDENVDFAEWEKCNVQVRRDLVVATAASSAVACFLMGAFANMPLALAPGMGINAYFTFNVVWGGIPYETALAAVFIEGIIFVLLAVTGGRAFIARCIPECIKFATAGGIGLFLAHIGLQSSQGIGLVTGNSATLVTAGGCPPEYRDEDPDSDWYQCEDAGRGLSLTMWFGIIALLLMAFLLMKKFKGAVITGIALVTFISWIPGTAVSYFEESVSPGAEERYEYFSKGVDPPSLSLTGLALDFSTFADGSVWNALITFLYIDLLDTTGTLYSMASFAGLMNENGSFEGEARAYMVDGMATVVGSLMGTSPVTTFVESGAGIEEGAKTGLAAVFCSFYFFLALFFAPILASVPPWATGPALILVGSMMIKNLVHIRWDNVGEAVPAFLTVALMPLTYSIAYGLLAGLGAFVILNLPDLIWDLIQGRGFQRLRRSKNVSAKEADSKTSRDDATDFDKVEELPSTQPVTPAKGQLATGQDNDLLKV
ncbi:unnamed protein product [Vitrella brassicaformis CCMP3155]|uniref:Uncharacterized protein n=2 Tax=Vitrella brassicaformis TaxID=1169539 RepID=A0A0G4GXR6_VITBC|nr:unnamed protein product [Vitrella brassicaformis CCMP3155]|mmetsp:Transcript_28297/g.81524  ORF Transcript_28297/g.81524 Transcript_28297/m.81524 type:complete len:553 (-) Transcript_28297:1784-3442(-)|eukprot:CEM35768.1 unnamed protein product [Vitrella brassicaformis CCMP3155]